MAYRDLREYLKALEERGWLKRVAAEVDKDWEVAAVCRQVFRNNPPNNRFAVMFERVKGHSIPIVAGVLGASPKIYCLALGLDGVDYSAISKKWEAAIANPVKPVRVSNGPCQEVVLKGSEADLFQLPVPVWTVGQDPGPYLTSSYVITRDPDTGIRNVGTYRVQVKDRQKAGIFPYHAHSHCYAHILKNDARNQPTPVALVLGADPTIGLCSVASIPSGVDELAVAGALRGQPVEVVKCLTNDLEVPATAEIVIEGEIPPNYREEEGPFGEYPGYMGPAGLNPVVRVTAITHRVNPIYQAFVSQMPPSESSVIRGIGNDVSLYKHLHDNLALPVVAVHLRESGGSAAYLAISMRKQHPSQPKQAIWGAWGYNPGLGKITVVVDEDIDVYDDFAVDWAMSFRVQPATDVFIQDGTAPVALDPSIGNVDIPQEKKSFLTASKMGIDATKKHTFPPLALPPKEHLEKVQSQWDKYNL